MRTLVYVIALLVVSCASLKKGAQDSSNSLKPLSIIFASNRFGTLETCDCVLKKLGGVDREWNLTNRWYTSSVGTVFSFSGGTTFVPVAKDYNHLKAAHYRRKSTYLVQALNKLGITLLSPSINDLALGQEHIQALVKQAKFPFISTNIVNAETNKPVFTPHAQLDHDGIKVTLLGLSSPPDTEYPITSEITVRDPLETLREFFSGKRPKKELVILLSSLKDETRQKIQIEFPQIHVILGAHHKTTATFNIRQQTGSCLYLNPGGEGRTLSLIELEMKFPIVSFYNPWLASTTKDVRHVWEGRIANVESKLEKSNLKDREREELQRNKEEFYGYLKRSDTIPLELSPETIPYRSTTVELDDNYILPDNDLTTLVKQYREDEQQRKKESTTKQRLPSETKEPEIVNGVPTESPPVQSPASSPKLK